MKTRTVWLTRSSRSGTIEVHSAKPKRIVKYDNVNREAIITFELGPVCCFHGIERLCPALRLEKGTMTECLLATDENTTTFEVINSGI